VKSSMALAALSLMLAAPAMADREAYREQSEKTIDVRGFSTLEILNARGRIDLMPSADAQVHVTALKLVSLGDKEYAQKVLQEITVDAGVQGDRYVIEVHYPRRHDLRIDFWDLFKGDGGHMPLYEVRVACAVPKGLAVRARETSGDIHSEGVSGVQTLESTSGDIEVESAGAALEAGSTSGSVSVAGAQKSRVRSVSGDVSVRDVAGPLRASTTSGSITVTGAQDSLSLSSVSGDIRADRAPRGLSAETTSGGVVVRGISGTVKVGSTSGDVKLSLRDPLRGLEAGTSSGGIRIELDPAIACALEMRTSSGELDVQVPMQMRNASRHGVTGSIRGGGTPVSLRTSSGDITVVGGSQ
jgi:hypothetical protein